MNLLVIEDQNGEDHAKVYWYEKLNEYHDLTIHLCKKKSSEELEIFKSLETIKSGYDTHFKYTEREHQN
jgi:hypothetical protein